MEARRTGDAEQALTLLDQAINKDPRGELARVAKVQVLLGLDRIPEAKQIVSEVSPLARKDEHVARLIARIEFASAAQELAGNAELKRRVKTNPGDLQARLDLAKALICESDYQGALIQLLEIVRANAISRTVPPARPCSRYSTCWAAGTRWWENIGGCSQAR
jgi:putative thioredoxin